MSLKFTGLHAHTVFSVADGLGYPKDHYKYAQENGMNALATTDHGNANAFGYMAEESLKFKKAGNPFKVIYGVEAYFHPSLSDWKKLKEAKDSGDEVVETFIENEKETKGKYYDPIRRRHHLVIVAKNYIGLTNLFRLITESYRQGFYRFPRVDYKMLEKYNDGLIVSTACLGGLPSWTILRDHEDGAQKVLKSLENELGPMMNIFGKDRMFLEIQFNKLPEQKIVNDYLIKFSKKTGFKTLATVDSHYCNPNLWKEREIYRLIGWQKYGRKASLEDVPEKIEDLKCELYPKNGDQLYESYKQIYPGREQTEELDNLVRESIERSYDIAWGAIDYIYPDGSYKLPKYVGGYDSEFEELKKLCIQKMKDKKLDKEKEYVQRLARELKVIRDKNFSLYFLTLVRAMDTIRAKILVGPGRGSGAGSLVCYLLNITQLDPIEHDLLFERFLSEYRTEAPDIDTDVEDRDIARDVLGEEFGHENVVAVSNFNTLKLKSLIKDYARLYDIPFEEVNAVTKIMEDEARQPLLDEVGGDQKFYEFSYDGAMRHSPTFRKFMEKYPELETGIRALYKQVITLGRHAGGVIVSDDAKSHMPIIKAKGGIDQTPWSEGLTAKHLEQWGLIKYDFLGLGTLRIIRRCIELILEDSGIENPTTEQVYEFYNKHLHPDIVKQGEEEVFKKTYCKGRFPGVFQFAETGVQSFCVRSQPTCVDDISAITALWRPGPLKGEADKKFLNAKSGDSNVGHEYNHPTLRNILAPTYGCLLYQEQFMAIANRLGGFSLTDADKLRKLLVKPVASMAEKMKQERLEAREKFVDGCVSNGLDRSEAENLWDEEILGFISYGFNKSHSMSYAYVSYQSAWLLAKHEEQWIRAYLEVDSDRDKAVQDAIVIGYKMGKPDILKSGKSWRIEDKVIFPSLVGIKGIGEAAVDELIQIRKENSFDDFFDFCWYLTEKRYKNGKVKIKRNWRWSKFNKKCFDNLLKLEAFDSLHILQDQGGIFVNYKHAHDHLIGSWDKLKRGTIDLEGPSEEGAWQDWEREDRIDFQKDLLGTYDKTLLFTPKVLDFFSNHDILPLSDLSSEQSWHWFIVKDFAKGKTKNGKEFYKLKITDLDEKPKKLNYFGPVPDGGIKKNSLYISMLHVNGDWINVPFGQKLLKAS